jgi:hypothetical protein
MQNRGIPFREPRIQRTQIQFHFHAIYCLSQYGSCFLLFFLFSSLIGWCWTMRSRGRCTWQGFRENLEKSTVQMGVWQLWILWNVMQLCRQAITSKSYMNTEGSPHMFPFLKWYAKQGEILYIVNRLSIALPQLETLCYLTDQSQIYEKGWRQNCMAV